MNERQRKQLEFDNSDENIILGLETDLPIPLEVLCDYNKLNELRLIDKEFKNGLTAIVLKLHIDGLNYNLKMKREKSLVQNIDGQTSFLNEVQRRKDFELLRINNEVLNEGIVQTIYANYRLGIILSKWIEGESPKDYNRNIFRNLFSLTWEIEKNGLMEWDLCDGNLLVDGEENMYLFDFGYMYRHNPLKEYNSEGTTNPLFNSVERFETRAFMPHLLEIKDENKVLEVYRIEKEEAIKVFNEKVIWLIKNKADKEIIETNKKQLDKWRHSLQDLDKLKKLYFLESTRSYVLDIHDDISGKSCTDKTILKIKKVLETISVHHNFLVDNNGYLWDDRGLSKEELLSKYKRTLNLAHQYITK